jgi:hypothetical protein
VTLAKYRWNSVHEWLYNYLDRKSEHDPNFALNLAKTCAVRSVRTWCREREKNGMGDRCYVSLTCHKLAREAVKELGLVVLDDPEDGSLDMEDSEANYANQDSLEELAKRGIAFYGSHSQGGEYDPCVFTAADGESIWVNASCNDPVARIDRHGRVNEHDASDVNHYYEICAKAHQQIHGESPWEDT